MKGMGKGEEEKGCDYERDGFWGEGNGGEGRALQRNEKRKNVYVPNPSTHESANSLNSWCCSSIRALFRVRSFIRAR